MPRKERKFTLRCLSAPNTSSTCKTRDPAMVRAVNMEDRWNQNGIRGSVGNQKAFMDNSDTDASHRADSAAGAWTKKVCEMRRQRKGSPVVGGRQSMGCDSLEEWKHSHRGSAFHSGSDTAGRDSLHHHAIHRRAELSYEQPANGLAPAERQHPCE